MAANKTRPAHGRRDFLKIAGGVAAAATAGCAGEPSAPAAAAQPAAAQQPAAAPQNDRGIWISWYDLPEQGRDEYFKWLHETYLPEILKRPGYRWAAHYRANERVVGPNSTIQHTKDPIGTGYHFILLIAAEDTNVFADPTPSQLHASLPEDWRKMLAMRQGERVNITCEAGRLNGTALGSYREGIAPAPAIQIGSFNCPLEYEEELQGGYFQGRLKIMASTPTNVRNRNLKSVAGWAKHVILYEYLSAEGFKRDYEGMSGKAPLGYNGNSVVPKLIHAPNGPNGAQRIWPPIPSSA